MRKIIFSLTIISLITVHGITAQESQSMASRLWNKAKNASDTFTQKANNLWNSKEGFGNMKNYDTPAQMKAKQEAPKAKDETDTPEWLKALREKGFNENNYRGTTFGQKLSAYIEEVYCPIMTSVQDRKKRLDDSTLVYDLLKRLDLTQKARECLGKWHGTLRMFNIP